MEKTVRSISGRRLTEERMARRRATSRHFDEEPYGVSLDSPRRYILTEGGLPEMDAGLGYLGPIPMEFAEPGGVRIVTVEVPPRAHLGTDFVNAFVTVSVFPNSIEDHCSHFAPELDQNLPALTRTISGIEFTGIPNSEAADTHEYFGKYFHGYSQGSCYEIGYGVVTAGGSNLAGLKELNTDAVLQRLEKIVDTISITPRLPADKTQPSTAVKTDLPAN
jgi:hypothetical protein